MMKKVLNQEMCLFHQSIFRGVGFIMMREMLKGKMYRLHIPFQGDSELLRFRPNPFSLSAWSNFTISYDSVYVDILDINGDANEIKRECDSYVNTLREMMSSLEKNYSFINKIMPDHIQSMFTIRKKQIQKEHKELVDIGIPIKGQMLQKTYTVPVPRGQVTDMLM